MAETDTKPQDAAEKDQSMEEILQSIRRIIAEEGDEIKAGTDERSMSDAAIGSDVLELTDMVKEDGSVVKVKEDLPPPAPAPEPPAAPVDILSNIDQALGVSAPAAPAPKPVAPEPKKQESLLSTQSMEAAASALKSFVANTGKETAKITSPAFRSGGTVEDLVIEALRPMLKEWLDANLPTIVERTVEKEVKRIAATHLD